MQDLYAAEPQAPEQDVETLSQFYAQNYQFIYRTVKSIDPNHLYFGFWILPGVWDDESDWGLIASNVDVIGYDIYGTPFHSPLFDRPVASAGKPVLTGEFSFPPVYGYQRGFGACSYCLSPNDDAGAGDLYAQWLKMPPQTRIWSGCSTSNTGMSH